MKRKLLTITTVILGMTLATQAQVLPSPASQGNVKNGTNPVSLFSGTVSMGVPLYSATAKNGASVPVSIGYNASGIKVNEVAGPVGLGWQLYAGGTITRVTRGIPDEYGSMVDPSSITNAMIQDILDEDVNVDSEKDLFFFNFPGGGGKFIFEQSLNSYATASVWCNNQYANNAACVSGCQDDCVGGPNEEACQQNCAAQCAQYTVPRWVCEPIVWTQFQTLPYSDMKIEYTFINFSTGSWRITDAQGVVYTFGQREVTTSSSTEPDGSVYGDEYTYVSTWYLTSITYPNVPSAGGITFTYSSPVNLTTITSEYKTLATGPGSGSNRVLTVSNTEETKHKTVIGQRFIESVNFPKGSINFTYANREDLTDGRRLTQIDLKDKGGSVVSSTVLNQTYFSANRSYKQGGTNNCGIEETCRRLKLASVHRDGGLVQSFTYRNEEGYSGTGVNYYELPPRDSYYFDHWGYWNAGEVLGNNYQKYPRLLSASVPELPGVNYQLSSGVDRVPYSDYALANILTRIDYPTGGYTKYEYFANSSRGGAKISSVKSYDESDQLVSGSSYSFVSETAVPWPSFHYMYDQGADKLAIYQQSKSSALGLNGPTAGFNTATVTDLMGQGKVVYTFNNDYRSTSTLPTRSQWGGSPGSYTNQGNITSILNPPYPLYSMVYYDRGSYDKVQSYNAANSLVSEKIYTYDPYNVVHDYVVSNLALEVKKEDESVFLSKYDIAVRTNRLASVTEKFYDAGGDVTSTSTFDYHPTYKNLRTTATSVKSDGYGSKSITKYPGDISSSSIHDVATLNAMESQHIIGIPVQQESQIHLPDYGANVYKTNGVSITSFKTVGSGLRVPNKTFTLPLDAPIADGTWSEANMIEVNHMVSYNPDGLVTQQVGLDGIATNYVYDSEGYLTQTEVNGRTTNYVYNPLVGIQQVTDANNRKVTYEYDQRNRLLLTRNDDDEITTRYKYEAATDDLSLSAAIEIQFNSTEGDKEDFPHNFSLSNINCPYGECSYSWNWGDGTSNGTGTSVSHTYINPGTYQIIVTVTNPEYDTPLVITRNVHVTNYNLAANININPNGAGQLEDLVHSFNLSNIYCPTGGCTYTWNWGDGTSNSTGSTPSHWFKEPGTYNVAVTITNATYNETATVNKSFSMINYDLSAVINIAYNNACQFETESHDFSLSSIYCPTGGCSYSWNWKDGTPNGTGSSTSHSFPSELPYGVEMTIYNTTYNETQTITKTANIKKKDWTLSLIGPETACTVEPPSGSDVKFTANTGTLSGCLTYTWKHFIQYGGGWSTFANSSESEAWFPATELVDNGNHIIWVTVEDENGRIEEATLPFAVSSCGGNGGGASCSLSSSPGTYNYSPSGPSKYFGVTTVPGAATFSVTNSPSWITITSVTANGFWADASSNAGGSNRSGTITLQGSYSGATCTRSISVSQDFTSNPCPTGCSMVNGQCISDSTGLDCGL
ncbi:MAG: PKD domain-containing protein [Cyclobacteriaceae bacterium]